MELFDKKYVHFMWDEELEGKKGFVANGIAELRFIVNHTQDITTTTVRKSDYEDTFVSNDNGVRYRFFYYDPNYDCKKAYYEGKQIQYKDINGNWKDAYKPAWRDEEEYRIKPEASRMTYRQLAEWLAKGNGEGTTTLSEDIATIITYPKDKESTYVIPEYKIRRWGSDEWIEPTVDVYMEDCK